MSSLRNLVRQGTKEGLRLPIPYSRFYRQFGVTNLLASGGTASQSGKFSGGVLLNAGSGATSYAKAAWSSAFNQINYRTGAGPDFGSGLGAYGIGLFYLGTSTAGQAIRFTIGDDNGAPTVNSTQNQISTRGYGFEIYNNSGTKTIRLFAHNGTTYSTSASTATNFNLQDISRMQSFYIKNDSAGNIYFYFSESASNGVIPDLPINPTLQMSGGPTNATSALRYVSLTILMDGTNNPANSNASLADIENIIFTTGI